MSLVIPCYNEEATIELVLAALYRQTYPRSQLEVVIADGRSKDRTREKIGQFCDQHPDFRVVVVDNPRRIIPAAINTAVAASSGEVIIRLDAHSVPDERYVEHSVRGLQESKGDNVGGVWIIQPGSSTWLGRSIAAAAGHPFGVGDALYRYASNPQEVDTVPFGAFYRATFERIGKFDESLQANEDYEFNARLRQAGGKIYLDPAIRSKYFARPDLASLARQYWRYGFWKWRMLKRYPSTLRWRQALPPLFVAGVFFLALAAVFWPLARMALAAVVGLYVFILAAAALKPAFLQRDPRLIAGMPLAIMTMHFSWGAGFLYSILAGKG